MPIVIPIVWHFLHFIYLFKKEVQAPACVWRSECKLQKLVLSFQHVTLGIELMLPDLVVSAFTH